MSEKTTVTPRIYRKALNLAEEVKAFPTSKMVLDGADNNYLEGLAYKIQEEGAEYALCDHSSWHEVLGSEGQALRQLFNVLRDKFDGLANEINVDMSDCEKEA